ncbi:MAG: YbjN domain-containing protein [Paracoccaceae bacterium]
MLISISHTQRRLALWSAVFALFSAYAVKADEALVPPEPWEIVHTARAFGPAEVGRDSLRDPTIEGAIDGTPYRISFYGCWLGRKCETILFQAEFENEDWSPDLGDLDAWNAKALFGRAWLREDGRVALDHAVAMADGLPRASLDATFEAWRMALAEYKKFLDF